MYAYFCVVNEVGGKGGGGWESSLGPTVRNGKNALSKCLLKTKKTTVKITQNRKLGHSRGKIDKPMEDVDHFPEKPPDIGIKIFPAKCVSSFFVDHVFLIMLHCPTLSHD